MEQNPINYNINDNDTPIDNKDNESLLPPIELMENNQSNNNNKYPTCELFYKTGEDKKISDYDLVKHIDPLGFFEVINCRIVEMVSQTKMKFNLSFDNSPEAQNVIYIL